MARLFQRCFLAGLSLLMVGLLWLGPQSGAARGGVLDPANPDLRLWLKADSLSGLTNGQAVGTWTDSGGQANHLSEATNRPSYVEIEPALNNQAAVRFDGANDRLSGSLNPSLPFTIFAVTKYTSGGASTVQGWFGGGDDRIAFGNYNGTSNPSYPNNTFWAWAPTQYSTFGQENSLDAQWNVHAYTIGSADEATWTWYLNGTPAGSPHLTSGTPQPYSSGISVGWSGYGSEFFRGDVAEVILFDGILSSGEISEVNGYLQRKYLDPTSAPELISPVAVPFSSGEPYPGWEDVNAIDGDLGTTAAIKDDTLTGSSSSTVPPGAENPVTGHMIFDLGGEYLVSGANLISRDATGGPYNPEDVDYFYFADDDPTDNALVDDIEGDPDIVLLAHHTYVGLTSSASDLLRWDTVLARYIGLRVNSSYEDGPTHFNFQIAEMQFLAAPVPEPSTLVLLLLGAVGSVAMGYRRRSV